MPARTRAPKTETPDDVLEKARSIVAGIDERRTRSVREAVATLKKLFEPESVPELVEDGPAEAAEESPDLTTAEAEPEEGHTQDED